MDSRLGAPGAAPSMAGRSAARGGGAHRSLRHGGIGRFDSGGMLGGAAASLPNLALPAQVFLKGK